MVRHFRYWLRVISCGGWWCLLPEYFYGVIKKQPLAGLHDVDGFQQRGLGGLGLRAMWCYVAHQDSIIEKLFGVSNMAPNILSV